MNTKSHTPISPERLYQLLGALFPQVSRPGDAESCPDLESLRRALELASLRFLSATGGENKIKGASSVEGDLRIRCRHGEHEVGVLVARGDDGDEIGVDDRWILALAADRIALSALQRAPEASSIGLHSEDERGLLGNVIAGLPNGVIVVDAACRILLMNAAARNFFGGDEAPEACHGAPIDRYLPQGALQQRLQQVLSGASEREVIDLSRGAVPTGRDYNINIFRMRRGNAWAATLVVRDMTEQRKLDEQVLRMGRMASIGQLAAGVAHEIRNPLTGINITLDMLREEPALTPEGREMVVDISREIDRLEALIRGLLDFARPQPAKCRPMRLAKALEWHRTFAEQCRKKGVHCVLALGQNPKIEGDPERLKQLFLNLAINALEATEPGGTVTVRTAAMESSGNTEAVRVEVTDTGAGMSDATVRQVFDPFFTTKNEGTGLGLSIAHSIAEQHGGRIDVSSTPGRGTTFAVELPARHLTKDS